MRILQVIATVDPKAGGVADAVGALVRFLPAGYEAEIVSLDPPDAPFLSQYPCKVHALGPGRSALGYSAKLVPWLRANRERFDGVMVNGLWQYSGFASWLALHGRTPYVVFPHGMLDPYFKRRFPLKHMKKWPYWLLSDYRLLRDAYRVLFTTTEEAELAKQSFWLHRWNGVVVPFGANRPPADGDRLREAFLVAHPQLRGRRFVLYLGRIHRKKGCDLLIDAFVRLAALDPELDLVMAGPDGQGWSAELKQQVAGAGLSERVHWPGMLAGEVKWGSFFASEVFILPSHQENFGIAVAEAMACGRPVLLSDKVNIAAEIAGDHAGLLEADTQDGTDNLLRRWIAMPTTDREDMGRRALATFDARYDMRRSAETINRIFEARGVGSSV